MPALEKRDIIVIGASAGGTQALRQIVAGLPADMPAAILVVVHIGVRESQLPEILTAHGRLPAMHAVNGEPIEQGRIYVAPPDHHLLVVDNSIRLSRGPKENCTRPAVDPLFRSAALSYGPRVIGVILTGYLDDGTAGLQAVKACGGIAVVQDPADAQASSMPQSAARNTQTDYVLPLDAIAAMLVKLTGRSIGSYSMTVHRDLMIENEAAVSGRMEIRDLEEIGKRSPYVCPECQGPLWEIRNAKPIRYRCHVGHSLSALSLHAAQAEAAEGALWIAVRTLQEQQMLIAQLSQQCRENNEYGEAAAHETIAERTRAVEEIIRELALGRLNSVKEPPRN
jgi:two-component system, chemotaxis family, protein-glutamate methylesterase/glutaminase